MSGFSAYPRAVTFLYDVLTTPPIDDVVGVFEDDAAQGATRAGDIWIEFEQQAEGSDVGEIAAYRIWTEFPFLVRAVTTGRDTIALQPIADAIDERLHRADGAAGDDGFVLSSVRTGEHHGSSTEDGVEYRELGGFFNVIVQPVPAP